MAAVPLMGAADPDSAPAPKAATDGTICHSDTKEDEAPPARAILAGYGSGGFKVTTASPEAQAYFDNGMQLAHAFAHKAAIGAFKRAEQLDPTCAMCAWGEAWARGPTINYSIDKKEQAELVKLADKAAVLGANAPANEKALIAALQKRYHNGGGAGRGDDAFAQAMDDLVKANPDDDEIAIIAADAWMIPAVAKEGTPKLDRPSEILKTVLARSPDNSGAIHFYIHVTEMRNVGVDALPYALKLQTLAPKASHLVHMPSHTYFWTGRYQLAEQSNLDAVVLDQQNAERLKPKDGVYGLIYHGHNVQYGEGGALLDGDAKGGLSLASGEVAQLPKVKPDQGWDQIGLGSAYFVYGRYGSPEEVAALPQPGAKLGYADLMWRYGRGEAAARAGDATRVKAEAAAMGSARPNLKAFKGFQDKARSLTEVARLVLIGRAAMLEQRYGDAATAYRKAADLQEKTLGQGGDPPIWWYPVRRSLAAALLADGKIKPAETEARAALTRWPYDPVSLRLMADIHTASGESDEAKKQLDYARSNWTGDITKMPLALM